MNTTRAKKKLIKRIEGSSNHKYNETNDSVEHGDTVLIYGKRFDRGKTVDWRIQDILPNNSTLTLPHEPGYKQLVLKGTIHTENIRFGCEFTDIEIVEASDIEKPKDEIKSLVVNLWRLGWPTKYVNGSMVIDIDETVFSDHDFRPIETDDIKITTIRGQGKSMHLGHNPKGALYKLGVNWALWHQYDATDKIFILTHEMVHCSHSHHRESFFLEHANVVANIANIEGRRKRANNLFEHDVDWELLKAKTLKGVHRQAQELDTTNHPHRRAAANALVEEMEPILGMDYETARCLYLSPPTNSFQPQWIHEFEPEEGESWPPYEELRPDDVEIVNGSDITLTHEYTDEELMEQLHAFKTETNNGITKYVYPENEVPVITDSGEVVENKLTAALLITMHEAAMKPAKQLQNMESTEYSMRVKQQG